MKNYVTLIAILFYFQGYTQVLPDVSVDTLFSRMIPIYSQAIKSGIYDLPRDTCWLSLKKYESKDISFQVPNSWLNLGGAGSIVEVAFDASGLYLPETFNDQPVLVGLFLLNLSGNSLEEAKGLALKDYRSNADRVFEPNYQDSVHNFKLQSGEMAFMLHTRFSRISSGLNQSRYDLICFSEKSKKAYSVMVSVQYADESYSFEKKNELSLFAVRLFSQVRLE